MNKGQAEILVEYCNGMLGKYYENYLIETIFIAPPNKEKFREILQNIKEGKLDLNLEILQKFTSFEVYVLLLKSNKTSQVLLLRHVLSNILNNINSNNHMS